MEVVLVMGTQLLMVFLSKLPKLLYPILLISPYPGNPADSRFLFSPPIPEGRIFSQTLSAELAIGEVEIEAGVGGLQGMLYLETPGPAAVKRGRGIQLTPDLHRYSQTQQRCQQPGETYH